MVLLQTGIETEGYIFIGTIALIISILFTRWVFAIDAQLKNQKRTNALLEMLAEKAGYTREEINRKPSEG